MRVSAKRGLGRRLVQSLRCRAGLGPSMVHDCILDRAVDVRFGLTYPYPEKDDGWTYALITRSSLFFDVGCNVGLFSLLSCLDDPRRRVVAIDANPRALTVAAENLFANGYASQVSFVLAFASDRDDDEVEFFTVGTGAAGSRFAHHARTASARHRSCPVRTTTLDRVADELDRVPDLVKIDVEGAEAEVLGGARQLACRHRPRFLVEMHSAVPMTVNGDRVLHWCRTVGYAAYYLAEHRCVATSAEFAHRGRCHLLLQPEGESYPEYLKGIAEGASLEAADRVVRQWKGE